MNTILKDKLAFLKNHLSPKIDVCDDLGLVILTSIYEVDDIELMDENSLVALFSIAVDTFAAIERLESILEVDYGAIAQIVAYLTSPEYSNNLRLATEGDVVQDGDDYTIRVPDVDLSSTDAIPHVIKKLLDHSLEERAGGAITDEEVINGITWDVRNSVLYEYAHLVMKEFYADLLNDDYFDIEGAEPFSGCFGKEGDILVVPCNSMLLPDDNNHVREIFDQLADVALSIEGDVFLAAVQPCVNDFLNATCFGYGYDKKACKWFPVYLCNDKSFSECYKLSRDGDFVIDQDALLANAYAKIQAGMSRDNNSPYAVLERAYPDSDWISLELETIKHPVAR